jgi:small nuclear ribonucleoprotein (snRNP)-like protein
MLPLSLLRTSVGHPMLVELKNGETYNGHLVNCDTWMNLHLREVICTSKDGDRFWRMAECYVRGNTVKYLRVPPEVPLPWLSRPPHPYPGCICIPPARLRGSQQTHETLLPQRGIQSGGTTGMRNVEGVCDRIRSLSLTFPPRHETQMINKVEEFERNMKKSQVRPAGGRGAGGRRGGRFGDGGGGRGGCPSLKPVRSFRRGCSCGERSRGSVRAVGVPPRVDDGALTTGDVRVSGRAVGSFLWCRAGALPVPVSHSYIGLYRAFNRLIFSSASAGQASPVPVKTGSTTAYQSALV